MPITSKEMGYEVRLDADGTMRTEDDSTFAAPERWSAEHLLLASILRCTAKSLDYSARKKGVAGVTVSGSAKGLVRRREEDGRFAVVRTDLALDVTFDPKPGRAEEHDILTWAERGCFIGSSLTAKPIYHWNVS
ncbi:MAG: OsmC family protein [Actinobacteria bacterium]|nr:OsmC family protein [Actinomycetota bacterium]MBV8599025.1 OsmC family protein [Actinomycetota bacterium]